MTCSIFGRRLAVAVITLSTLLAVHARGTGVFAGEDLETAVLRELPPIRLYFNVTGWVLDEQVHAMKSLLKDKLITAGIELIPDETWPPTDEYGLTLQIDARINESRGGCGFMVRTNLTEYARPVRKIEGVDAAKLTRVISWRGPRLIAYSDMGQSDCWALLAKLAIRGVDEFVEDYRAANAALPRDSAE